jgi:hypothetical protein
MSSRTGLENVGASTPHNPVGLHGLLETDGGVMLLLKSVDFRQITGRYIPVSEPQTLHCHLLAVLAEATLSIS